ncbi:hypothetical protein [Maricaulis sp. W15]|uniref:hypothetical protein n=1 Tax=Maricaulis sp. W15 TaxID=1772333 RepID=UPI000ACC7D0B|nr:hypothetical protein [Maricaulis sp. W15]
MTDRIIAQGLGWTIARTDVADTLVPYGQSPVRDDGTQNYGWIDLRNRPDLVSEIPELRKSQGLGELVRAMAAPASQVMSGGCECSEFARDIDPPISVGGFVTVMFRDVERNRSPDTFVTLAEYLLAGIEPTDQHNIGFEFIVEPLKSFFGHEGCFGLMVKPFGSGANSNQAWAAFDYAASALARSLTRHRRQRTT